MDLLRSLPLGLYLEQPITWLHRLDPRVKLAWLMSFLAVPILANSGLRILLVVLLILVTLTARIPLRVWRQQMVWLLMLSFFILILGAISPDTFGVNYQPRLPPDQLSVNPSDYQYILFQKGPVTVTRRSLNLAVNLSTILFTLIYSSNLYLLTTAPEEITAGIESLMRPLRRLNLPVTEIALTLTLSLRFIPLVLEEVQNLVRSVRTRAINWKKLGLKGSLRLWLMIAERLLENLLLRAEQMANAMMVRGFTSPNKHRVQWHQLRLKRRDWITLVCLVALWGVRLLWGSEG
jgi:energy-coupling factor transport system permease protein